MVRSGGRGVGPLAVVVLVVLSGTVAGVGVAVRSVDAGGPAATGATVAEPGPGERLSFEDSSVGEDPPAPWTVRAGEGIHRVSSSYPGHGDLSVHVRGASGLGTSEVAVPVDLTGVATIRFDAYVARTETVAGEINVQVRRAGTDRRTRQGFTLKPLGWHNDTDMNVTAFDGEWSLVVHARGSGNGGYFDDVRFLDADGDPVPTSEVVVGASDGDDGDDGSGSLLVDGFEDGDLREYDDVEAATVTTEAAYAGERSLRIVDRNDDIDTDEQGRIGNVISRSFPESAPSRLTAAVRIDRGAYNTVQVKWKNASGATVHDLTMHNYHGELFYGGKSVTLSRADPFVWYYVELTDIDWERNVIGEVRVNDETAATDVSFHNPGDHVSGVTLRVHDGGTGSVGYFDEVAVPTGEDDDGTTPSAVTAPFSHEFESDLQGWSVGYAADADRGTLDWSSEYGGSARLHAEGSPGEVRMSRRVDDLRAGDRIRVEYGPERFEYAASGLSLKLVTPGGNVTTLDAEHDHGFGSEQNGTMVGTVPRDMPNDTRIRLDLRIWPGSTTVYVKNASVTRPTGPRFEVTGLTAPSSVGAGSPVTYTAEITNTGVEAGTRTVTARFAGETVDSRTVTLDAGASATLAFTATAPDEPGTYDAVVDTGDDTASASVDVVGQAFVCGQSTGDPHVTTFGGASYDFMAAGDFVLAREPAGDLVVVARQAPVSESVSLNNATATVVGGDRVVIDAGAATPVSVDGEPTPIADSASAPVGDGGEIRRQGRTYTVYYPGEDGEATTSDEHLTVDVIGDRVDVELCLHPDREEEVEGLFGDIDGDASDDVALADGTALDRPLDTGVLYGEFRADWRATGAGNPFPTDYYVAEFPREIVTVADLSGEERERAEAVLADTCLDPGTPQYRDALVDVALTGDESYVASACQVDRDDIEDVDTGQPRAGVSLALRPNDTSVVADGTATLDVVAEGIDAGVGSYDLTVNSSDAATVALAGGTTDIGGSGRTPVAADGSGVRLGAFNGDTADAGPVTIGTVTVEGIAPGTVDLSLRADSVADEAGDLYAVAGTSGATLTVREGGPDVGDDGRPATDPDDDGVYEDVNGDGRATPADATVLFNAAFRSDPAVTDNVALFDFNADDRVTPADATVLFEEVF